MEINIKANIVVMILIAFLFFISINGFGYYKENGFDIYMLSFFIPIVVWIGSFVIITLVRRKRIGDLNDE